MQPSVTDSAATQSPGRILFVLIAILSLGGVIVSAVSLQRHYAKSDTAFCEFNKKFSCDIVNRSEQSSIIGIPVAGIGVAGYAFLFILSTFWKGRADTPNRLLGAAIAGLAFALYLTYVEAYVLETWCILCLSSLAMIFLISVLAIGVKLQSSRA